MSFVVDYFSRVNQKTNNPPKRVAYTNSKYTVTPIETFVNRVICGDCTQVMKDMPSDSVDFILTDPPYLVNYRSRDGRAYENDDPNNAWWLLPAFKEMYRVLRNNSYMVCFYGYPQADKFVSAWKSAGFRPLEHFVWIKDYASSEFMVKRHHESAYLLVKGRPPTPRSIIRDVLEFKYTGNRNHPTEKPETALMPLIRTFSGMNEVVFDPFAGSGSTLNAAQQLNRRYIGIELSPEYARNAQMKLQRGY